MFFFFHGKRTGSREGVNFPILPRDFNPVKLDVMRMRETFTKFLFARSIQMRTLGAYESTTFFPNESLIFFPCEYATIRVIKVEDISMFCEPDKYILSYKKICFIYKYSRTSMARTIMDCLPRLFRTRS